MTTQSADIPSTPTNTIVVIVDDEQSILSSLKSLLRKHRYDLHVFDKGSAAVAYITHNTPDIIISDMRMPEMSGIEFLDQAEFICPTSTRLMLSGYEDKSIIFDAIAHGIAQQYIMKPWEDQELLTIIENVVQTRHALQQRQLDTMLQSISSLPSPPQARIQIQRILNNENRSISELAADVEKLPALVARILRIANSVYYAARQPISTTLEAVSFIGAEYVESLILAMSVFHHAEDKLLKEFAEPLDELWRHAVHRATLGRAIAEEWPGFKQTTIAYTVCLLQDVGFIIRFNSDPEKARQFVHVTKSLHLSMHEAESKVYTVPHTAVGSALLQLWNFPESIVTAIGRHHGDTEGDILSQIAQIADIVECGDHSRSHDAVVNPLVKKWQLANIL
jgi:HD-like signal output (HDOD) protein